ncbi:ribosome recycling factor [Rickettsiales bacterium]|nr:ribosome recycling factor [Rickettsiales bacterium]
MSWDSKIIQNKLQSRIDELHKELKGIRTGVASPGLLEHIPVEAYGQKMPLSQLATVDVYGNLQLGVRPFDQNNANVIEKGIQMSNLGFSCSSDGSAIIVRLPALTEETRQSLVKSVKQIGEKIKIEMRNIRRDAIENIKSMQKNKEISEDEGKRNSATVQDILDKFIAVCDKEVKEKSKTILSNI